MTAEQIAQALGGRRAGAGWMARCPAHDDREPSLSIRQGEDGRVLVRCHAGCEQVRLIAELCSRGLWRGSYRRVDPFEIRVIPRAGNARDNERSQAALAIWKACGPGNGTLVQTYLWSRGIHAAVPVDLRFHAGLRHPSGGLWPAMVALVTRGTDGQPLAVHRTFLARDGHSKALVEPVKMMLGPCRGGAVRLGPVSDRLMIAEGIETALSVMQATGQPAWAALSTSGLRTLELPAQVREVVLLADGDRAGHAAAHDAGLRWKCEGRRVRVARPPQGFDFNDVLRGRTLFQVEHAT